MAAKKVIYLFRVGAICAALALLGCGTLLPRETENAAQDFFSYRDVQFSYNRVVPFVTPVRELARFGFYTDASPNVEILSYLGVMQRFMPNASVTFPDLDPAVRRCIEARQRCTGYVFKLEHREQQRVGNVALDVLSFSRTTLTSGWSAEVLFLVDDGLVIYKLLSGNPNLDERRETVRPLGPLQDLSDTALNGVSHHVKSTRPTTIGIRPNRSWRSSGDQRAAGESPRLIVGGGRKPHPVLSVTGAARSARCARHQDDACNELLKRHSRLHRRQAVRQYDGTARERSRR